MLILCKTNIEVVCIMLDMIFRFIVFNMCRICWSLYQQKIIISIRLPTLPPLPIQCSLSIERKNKNMCIAFQNLQSAHEALAKHTLTNIGLLCIYNWCSKCDSNVISLYLFTLFIIWSTQQQKKETNIYPEKKPASVLVFVRKSWWLRIVNYTYTIHLFLLLFFSNWRTHFWQNKSYLFVLSCDFLSPLTVWHSPPQIQNPFVLKQQTYENSSTDFQFFYIEPAAEPCQMFIKFSILIQVI